MRSLAPIALVAMSVFACSSTETARPGAGKDAGNDGAGGSFAPPCDESICEGRTYKGQSLATCCVSARGCGVVVDGECITSTALRKLEPDAGGGPAAIGTAETVVLDPSCPDQNFSMGANVVLKGCCDKSGVCGASTADLGATTGFPIAAMCVTRAESRQFGQRTPDAGPEKACNYSAEAGAPSDAGKHD